jgi:hypothetical protein
MANTVHRITRRRVQGFIGRLLTSATLAQLVVSIAFAFHAGEARYHFDIKPRPLAEALMAFGAQAGASVVAPTELTVGKISNSVSGELTIQEALLRLLQGTGLGFEVTANRTIVIVRMAAQAVRALEGCPSAQGCARSPVCMDNMI